MIPHWSIGISMQGCSPSPFFWENVTFLGVPGPSRRAPPDLVPDRIRSNRGTDRSFCGATVARQASYSKRDKVTGKHVTLLLSSPRPGGV